MSGKQGSFRAPFRPPFRPGRRGIGPGPGPFGAMPLEKPKDFKGTLRHLLAYLRPHRAALLVVAAAAVASTAFTIVSPKILGLATTVIFEGIMQGQSGIHGAGIDYGRIGQILLLLAALYCFSALCGYLQQYIMAGVAQKTVYRMRDDLYKKLDRLPLHFFDSRPHGDILSRVTNDMDLIGTTLQQSLTQLITAAVSLGGTLVMMLAISGWLTLIASVTLPASFLITVLITRRSQKHFAAQQKELGELNGHVEEIYGGHMIVKAFGREKEAITRFEEINDRLYEAGWKAQFISGVMMPLLSFVGNIGYVLISVVGAVFVIQGRVAIGDVQAFIQYARHFSHPIVQTANIANIFQATIAAAERVFEILDEAEEEDDSARAGAPASLSGAVNFENVTFGYRPGVTVIDRLTIAVKSGQTVAIVGPTGAGKTTLVNLLMRFYEVNGGRITVDGVDIREIRRSALRSLFGMVLQDTWLFHGTIRENIAYGREEATEEEIVRAARVARADHFIRTLPDGYDTVLNEEASNLSQGQKQLLTIARAILADPAILILDEATSSVDTRTEQLIQKAMTALMQGRTSFVIAHRLSTIRNADLIIVMNEGRVIEHGTHASLLARNGFYADLYRSQFSTPA